VAFFTHLPVQQMRIYDYAFMLSMCLCYVFSCRSGLQLLTQMAAVIVKLCHLMDKIFLNSLFYQITLNGFRYLNL